MKWSKWPYWVRGGVIGIVIVVLFFSLFYSCTLREAPGPGSGWECFPFLLFSPLLPGAMLYDILGGEIISRTPSHFYWVTFVASVIIWFAIGAFVAFLYGKIKNR